MFKLVKLRKKINKNLLIFLLLILVGFNLLGLIKCFFGNWEVSDWRKYSNRYLVNYIFQDDQISIESLPKNFCRDNTYLLTIVTSAPPNKEKRMLIRHGFGHINFAHGKNIATYFIIGKSNDPNISKAVVEEAVKYNDIIRGNIIDHYNNLTLKIAVSFGIVSRFCQKTSRFLMKTDDDVIVNYPVIVKDMTKRYSSLKFPFIVGRLHIDAQRIMNPFDKWFIPTYMYFGSNYPDYASGTGYIMTAGISGSLLEASFDVPMIHMEDVYFTDNNFQISDWPKYSNRYIINYILKDNQLDIELLPRNFCQDHIYLLTMITSAPQNMEKRMLIRNGFGLIKDVDGKKIMTYFIIGQGNNSNINKAVSEEEATYNDIVRGHFIDHYNNLTLKVGVLFGIISTYCKKKVKFLMKTDDDVIVNYPVMINNLVAKYSLLTGPFIVGRLNINSHRIMNPFDKWYVPTYMYSGFIYPMYAGGSGYVVTSAISSSLFEASFDTPIIHMEDVYFTGIIGKEKLGIKLLNDDKFYCRWDKKMFKHCFDTFVFHGEPGTELADIKQLYSEFCSYLKNNNTEHYNIWNCSYFHV